MKKILALIAGLAASSMPGNATAQQMPCGEAKDISENLISEYHEAAIGQGITDSGWLMRMFRSESGSFTITVTPPQSPDIACILSSGDSWEDTKPLPGKAAELSLP